MDIYIYIIYGVYKKIYMYMCSKKCKCQILGILWASQAVSDFACWRGWPLGHQSEGGEGRPCSLGFLDGGGSSLLNEIVDRN